MQNDRFDAIPIPKELNSVVKAGIQEGIREQKRLRRNRNILRYSAAAAAALLAICAGVLLVSDPSLAAKLPFVGRIFSMVQEKVSYKGDFNNNAEVYVDEDSAAAQKGDVTRVSENGAATASGTSEDSPYVQTSNGLTVTISEANCSAQALYLALCIENEEAFPEDFMETMDIMGEYHMMYLKSDSYYNVPGLEKKDRGAENGYPGPYYMEGEFVDDHTFTGIIRVPLDQDVTRSVCVGNTEEAEYDADLEWENITIELPEQFTYYLEISDIYGELKEREDILLRDVDGEEIMASQAIEKHYEGTWNFAVDVRMNKEGEQIVQINKTNENGVGIAYVKKTEFEIQAELIYPGDNRFGYVIAICDADGKLLDSQGEYAEVFSVYGRNTDTVYVYVCDLIQFMDELRMNDQKIKECALFGTEVHF